MISKVYIVGQIKDPLSVHTQIKFSDARIKLQKMNLIAFNPVDTFLMYPKSKEKAVKHNLESLLNCNAVYVLKDANRVADNQIEIMLALKLNILIMHEF